jgi:hypothetical protein
MPLFGTPERAVPGVYEWSAPTLTDRNFVGYCTSEAIALLGTYAAAPGLRHDEADCCAASTSAERQAERLGAIDRAIQEPLVGFIVRGSERGGELEAELSELADALLLSHPAVHGAVLIVPAPR